MTHTMYVEGQALQGSALEDYTAGYAEWSARVARSLPFVVGQAYRRRDGVEVTCTRLSHDCALFSDSWSEVCGTPPLPVTLGWRYNRPQDRGRCTGSRYDNYRGVVPRFAESGHG